MKKLSTTALTLVNPSPTLGHAPSPGADQMTAFEQAKPRRHTATGTSPRVGFSAPSVDTKHREKRQTIHELNIVGQYDLWLKSEVRNVWIMS